MFMPTTLTDDADVDVHTDYIPLGVGELARDGLARRVYVLGGSWATLIRSRASTRCSTKTRTWRCNAPSPSCARRPYTVLDYCEGACTVLAELNPEAIANLTLSAKAEIHPNSTLYDDIGLDSAQVNAWLDNVNLDYSPDYIGITDRRDYFDPYYGWEYGPSLRQFSTCNYYTNLVAHDIAVNGTGIAMAADALNVRQPNVTSALFVSFKTDLLVSVLNGFGIALGPISFPASTWSTAPTKRPCAYLARPSACWRLATQFH